MHRVSTQAVDRKVRECATELRDSKLLPKLALSDMHASHAMYHKHCLVALYNHMHTHENAQSASSNSPMLAASVALADLTMFIDKSRSDSETAPVFKLSDLAKIHSSRLNELGMNLICMLFLHD